MKKIITLLALAFIVFAANAQAPQGFNYQAVARNTSGAALTNQAVGLQIRLLQGSAAGTAVYTETHSLTSSNIGLLNLVVGSGTPVTGTFNSVNWAAGPYFIEISMDVTGGTSYVLMGTQQLMSVPYALYAANAGTSGATGPTGANGTNGADGATGSTGVNGMDGAAGATGIAGATGTNGIDGATGATGNTGANGMDGATGNTGIAGATGVDGIDGATGVTGATGIAGTTGVTGATGFLSAGTAAGNTTYWDGSSWVLNSSNLFNNGGNIGIGTTTPGHLFQVANQTGASAISIAALSGNLSTLYLGTTTNSTIGKIDYNTSTNQMIFGTNSASRMYIHSTGAVSIGTATPGYKLSVSGSVAIPAVNTYRYLTAKTKKYKVGVADMRSVNSNAYEGRIDDGFNSSTVNGLNALWTSGGSPGIVSYFIAPVHLPDSAIVIALAAQLIKTGGSLQSVIELYRTDGSGYLSNTAQLIATAATTNSAGGIVYVTASSVNAAYNVIDNINYYYFMRWSGEQNTQNIRFVNSTISYQIYRSEY